MIKRLIFAIFIMCGSITAFAQYPNAPNKLRLGAQTTGDGLVFRTAGIPNWTPSGINNAWLAVDTLTGDLYSYQGGQWDLEVAGDLRQVYPKVINKSGVDIKRGQAVMVDYTQIIQGDIIRILPADGSGAYSTKLTMGIASTDIDNNDEGYITWFGYVREVKESDIVETGDTVSIGDILYLSPTQDGRLTNIEPTAPNNKVTMALVVRKPNANNITLLVRPQLNEDLGELNDVDLSGLADGQTIVWDSITGVWKPGTVSGATTFTIDQNQQVTLVIVDDNNATPWDGLSVIGVFYTAPASEALFTVNGVQQTLTFPTSSPPATQIASLHVAGGLTTLGYFDAERIDYDQEGSTDGFASSLFVVDSSSITYIGTENVYVKVFGVASLIASANASITLGVSLVGNSPPAGVTSSFAQMLNGVPITVPTQTAIMLITPNTKFEMVIENTTNVTVVVASFYSLTVEIVNL